MFSEQGIKIKALIAKNIPNVEKNIKEGEKE